MSSELGAMDKAVIYKHLNFNLTVLEYSVWFFLVTVNNICINFCSSHWDFNPHYTQCTL
jgi:hypothetical protein